MTTIAACGHFVAADGMLAANGSRQVQDAKKIHVEKGVAVYALSGTTGLFEPLIKWHQQGAIPGDIPRGVDLDWALMVITKDGTNLYTNRLTHPERHPFPWTMGTGNEYAMGAMKAGASAEEAVRIACEIDIHSGGEIQVVNIREALGMAPRLVEAG